MGVGGRQKFKAHSFHTQLVLCAVCQGHPKIHPRPLAYRPRHLEEQADVELQCRHIGFYSTLQVGWMGTAREGHSGADHVMGGPLCAPGEQGLCLLSTSLVPWHGVITLTS